MSISSMSTCSGGLGNSLSSGSRWRSLSEAVRFDSRLVDEEKDDDAMAELRPRRPERPSLRSVMVDDTVDEIELRCERVGSWPSLGLIGLVAEDKVVEVRG